MKNKIFRFEPKQTETRSVSRLFRFVSWNQKKNFRFVSVFRTFIETTETNRTVSKRTETIQNFLKNTKICSLNTTNLQRLWINKKKPFELSTMQGTETIPNLFFKKILPLDSMIKYSTECCVMQMTCEFHHTTMRLSKDFLSSLSPKFGMKKVPENMSLRWIHIVIS